MSPLLDVASQLLLDATTLLDVAALVLCAAFCFKLKPGLPQCGVSLALNTFATLSFTLAEHSLLLRRHLQPTFGV
ncbi:MAG: hypothetical protein H0T11_06330 [Chthoniobacterales bacterium]|nr:hypothetical protein [Chthoniobacterales bacterium]